MKTVVLDSPHQDSVVLVAIGKELKNGVETPLTDDAAAIALQNPHVRLVTDKETITQRVTREESEADAAEPDVKASPAGLTPILDPPLAKAPIAPGNNTVTPPSPSAAPAT
jgi:hypothetical protein